jgi:hypothetical protein
LAFGCTIFMGFGTGFRIGLDWALLRTGFESQFGNRVWYVDGDRVWDGAWHRAWDGDLDRAYNRVLDGVWV